MDWYGIIGFVAVFIGGIFLVIGAGFSDMLNHMRSGNVDQINRVRELAKLRRINPNNFAKYRRRCYKATAVCYLIAVVCLVFGGE